MPSKIWVVFNHGNGGSKAKLTMALGVGEPLNFTVHHDCACAISAACKWVQKTLCIEAPDPILSWTLEPQPPEIDGFSSFGAFAAVLLQECVREGIGCTHRMSAGTRALLPTIAAVCMDNVAISAEKAPTGDGFSQVGAIEEKLKSLAAPGIRDPAGVLAWNQEMPFWEVEKWNGKTWIKTSHDAPAELYERWHVPDVERPLPIIRAYDALDAIARVFELQRNHVARNILPFVKASLK